jgi:hypothetical protein
MKIDKRRERERERERERDKGKVYVQVLYLPEHKAKLEQVAQARGLPLATWIRLETIRLADEWLNRGV